MSLAHDSAVDSLVRWFQNLSPETVTQAGAYYAAGAVFRDPFNDVRGVPAIRRIYAHLFEQVRHPRFRVTQRYIEEGSAVLLWEFSFIGDAGDQATVIRGASHLQFDHEGLVTLHQDYWDPTPDIYQRVPLLGRMIGWVRQRLSAPQD